MAANTHDTTEVFMKTKLISILLVALLLIGCFSAFVSCDTDEKETDVPTSTPTETPTEPVSSESSTSDAPESDTEEPTVDATVSETEKDTEADTEVDTEKDTEPVTEPETDAETEPQGPAEPLCETCEFKSVKGIPTCKVCGYIAPCRGVHGYTSDLDGHWKPECEHCGKAAGKSQNHEYEEKVIDEGDLLVYSFRCTICKFKAYEQEVPYEINSFYSAGDLSYTDMSGSLGSGFRFESGVGYASYSSEKGGKSTVIVVSNGEVGDSSGRYLVMKVRLPASQSSFSLNIKSVGAYGQQTLTFAGLKSVWTTIIVDVTKAVSVQSVTDKETGITKDEVFGYSDMNGEYFLGDLRFVANAGEGESFDVAYVMMCETIEDAENFTKDEKTRIVYNDILNEKPDVDESVCVDENGNPIIHEYIINDDGTHTIEKSCHQCGLTAVSHEPHVYGQTIDENGDYTYACACGHSKYGAAVNKYIATEEIDTAGHSYYKLNKLGITEDEAGFDYASYSGQATTAQIIFARTGFSDAEAASAFPVGKANMFIIRMRTNTPAVSFGIQFGTVGAKGTTFRFPTAVAADGWATYVVDLAALIPDSYVADSNGEYTVQNFYFHIGGADFTSEVVYDVDFMAFVDEWEEVGALTPDEKVINVVASNIGGWVNTADKTCVGEHSYTMDSSDGHHKVVCGSCGYVLREYAVSSDIEKFMPAEKLAGITKAAGSIDLTLMSEGEGDDAFNFVRLDNMKINNDREGWMGWDVIGNSAEPVSGQYMIMKFRLPKDQLGQTFLEFYTATKLSLAAGMRVAINVTEDNEWHTVVIDLSKCVADPATYFQPDEDGYHVRYLQMRLFSGHQAKALLDENGNQVKKTYTDSNGAEKTYDAKDTKPTPEMYMDIAYIAYCDNISEVTEIIDTETFEYYEASQAPSIRNSSDGSCVSHAYSDVVEGEVHKIICAGCGEVAKTFTVSKDVNYYADLSVMNQFNSTLSKGLFDEENKIIFNRYEGTAAGHLNLTGGGSAGTWTTAKYQTGKYIVIKYRTNGGTFPLNISTKDNGSSKAFPEMTNRPEYSQIAVKTASAGEGKWAVALIEITESATNYTTGSEQEIGIMISVSGNYLIDLAYVAIVDSEDEAKTLLEEGETFEIGWNVQSGGSTGGDEGGDQGGTTPTPPAASEHNVTETVSDGENGAKVYTYTCSHCDVNIEKTVPGGVTVYYSAKNIAKDANVYYNVNGGNNKSELCADGEAYANVFGTNGAASQILFMRVQEDFVQATNPILVDKTQSVGSARYLVIRMRVNKPEEHMQIDISTTGRNGDPDGSDENEYPDTIGYTSVAMPLSVTSKDDFVTFVVDLETVIPEYYVKVGGEYVIDTLYFHFENLDTDTQIDIAYMAFAEDWNAIDGLVEENEVVEITSTNGTNKVTNIADVLNANG